nr:M24 family metallopeptidase [Brevibacillus marinus]
MNFTVSEYQERLQKTKQRMEQAGVEVLIVSDPANMNYLSGYDGWSFYVHQCLVVFLDEEQPLWIGRGQDAKAAEFTTWLSQENIIPYADDYVQSTSKHPMDFVASIIASRGKAGKTVGVEMDQYYFTAKCMDSLQKGLPNSTFIDATSLVNWVRIIKSEQEIAYMKRAGKIIEKAMQVGLELIEPGMRECDVVAKIYEAQISGTDEFGGDYPAIVPLLPAGEKTSTPHITWSDNRYKAGDLVILELAGCYRRYHAPMARTLSLGNPEQKVIDLAEAVLEGIAEALAVVKPGVTAEEVEAVWRTTIAKHGFVKDSRIGYSTGLNYPPDWGEHTLSLRQGDKTVLQPNMTIHMIPGIWLDNYGVEISEAFRVTETGCEPLYNFPRQLFIKQ